MTLTPLSLTYMPKKNVPKAPTSFLAIMDEFGYYVTPIPNLSTFRSMPFDLEKARQHEEEKQKALSEVSILKEHIHKVQNNSIPRRL